VLAAVVTGLLLLRSGFAHALARRNNVLGRFVRLIHLFLPRFPLVLILGVGLLWRAWRERQLLSSELAALSLTRQRLQNSVSELCLEEERMRRANTQLEGNLGVLRVQNDQLASETTDLKSSVAAMTAQNRDLLQTTNKLRGVLKIAGDSSETIVAVERKLFRAVDELDSLNVQMQANILEQRRRQLRDIFMKFDVDFESKISDKRQLGRMMAYVRAVYHAKMEKLDECLRDSSGVLRWDDFEAALLRDNFWSEHPTPHEAHLHGEQQHTQPPVRAAHVPHPPTSSPRKIKGRDGATTPSSGPMSQPPSP
jgi:cell division protein FtsL